MTAFSHAVRCTQSLVVAVLLITTVPSPTTAVTARAEHTRDERFSALAVSIPGGAIGTWRSAAPAWPPAGARTFTMQIGVTRWTTDAEDQALATVWSERGPEALYAALQGAEEAGFVNIPGQIGHRLRYAREAWEGDTRLIILAADRPLHRWSPQLPTVVEHNVLLVELRLDENGSGDGFVVPAARVAFDQDPQRLLMQSYANRRFRLMSVRER